MGPTCFQEVLGLSENFPEIMSHWKTTERAPTGNKALIVLDLAYNADEVDSTKSENLTSK